MTITRIGNPPVLPDGTVIPKVTATKAGNMVFCSGTLGVDANLTLLEGAHAQTVQALRNIEAVLAQVGGTLSDVAKVTVWLTDPADFAEFNIAYASVFGSGFPARSTVLSTLVIPGARVEIEAVAVLPE